MHIKPRAANRARDQERIENEEPLRDSESKRERWPSSNQTVGAPNSMVSKLCSNGCQTENNKIIEVPRNKGAKGNPIVTGSNHARTTSAGVQNRR